MALSAVNILHLNGPLEAKQTQTDLHTNDGRGPGVNVSLCVCVDAWKKQTPCVGGGDVVCGTRRECVCWTGRLILCDMGQEGMQEGGGR